MHNLTNYFDKVKTSHALISRDAHDIMHHVSFVSVLISKMAFLILDICT